MFAITNTTPPAAMLYSLALPVKKVVNAQKCEGQPDELPGLEISRYFEFVRQPSIKRGSLLNPFLQLYFTAVSDCGQRVKYPLVLRLC